MIGHPWIGFHPYLIGYAMAWFRFNYVRIDFPRSRSFWKSSSCAKPRSNTRLRLPVFTWLLLNRIMFLIWLEVANACFTSLIFSSNQRFDSWVIFLSESYFSPYSTRPAINIGWNRTLGIGSFPSFLCIILDKSDLPIQELSIRCVILKVF